MCCSCHYHNHFHNNGNGCNHNGCNHNGCYGDYDGIVALVPVVVPRLRNGNGFRNQRHDFCGCNGFHNRGHEFW